LSRASLDADAALASAVGCPPLPRSLTPPRRPLSGQRVVPPEVVALPRLSGRDSELLGSLVAAFLALQNTAGVRIRAICLVDGARNSIA
jgi:hypothetical protein